MHDARGVEVFQGLQQLVDDVLVVHVLQQIRPDHGVEIRLHVLEDEVDVQIVLRADHVAQRDHVHVAPEFE